MADIEIKLALYRGANAPPIKVPLPLADYTGSDIELEFTPRGGPAVMLSTAGGDLTLAPPDDEGRSDGVIMGAYGDLAESLPLGQRSAVDEFRVTGGNREKLGAGSVWVGGVGEFRGTASTQASGVVMQGPALFNFLGSWEPGAYAKRDAVTHLGSTWYADHATDEEPGPDALDWGVVLDGAGAAADRQAAQEAAGVASGAATTSTTKAGEAAESADRAQAASSLDVGATIYLDGGFVVASGYLDRSLRADATFDNLYAEVIAGTGSTMLMIKVGTTTYGPWVFAAGTPLILEDLAIDAAKGSNVSVIFPEDAPTITETYIKLWGPLT